MDDYDFDQLREEILSVRDSGVCNMFDAAAVQRAANEMEYYDLVVFIEEHKSSYVHFILHGKFE